MVQERISILRMLEKGKITVDEATALLDAIDQAAHSDPSRSDEPQSAPPDRLQSAQSIGPALEETSVSDVNLDRLTEMKIHGVTPEFIQEMHALELPDLSTDRLVEMRIHGVTPDYVLKMRALGFNPSVDKIIQMRIHGVTPDYVLQMEALGLEGLTLDRLIEMRIHGVDAEYLRTMKKLV